MRRWLAARSLAIAYAAIVLTVAAGFLQADRSKDADQRTAAQLCETVNDYRTVIGALINVALEDGSGTLELSTLPSFARLDPDTQAWVRELEGAAAQDTTNGLDARLRRFAKERLTPAECEP